MTTKAGRPAHSPTDRARSQVKMLSAMGIPDYEIAKLIGVSQPTLRKYYADELDIGHIEANAKVAQSLFKMATDPAHPKSAISAMFWMKCRAGWREKDEDGGKKEAAKERASKAGSGIFTPMQAPGLRRVQ